MTRKFTPKAGEIYQNTNGSSYLCLNAMAPFERATMQHTESLWTFTAIDCRIYEDGKIDWTQSIGGFFANEAGIKKTCKTCEYYDENQYWCKAFGWFTHTWPDDTCSAWTNQKEDQNGTEE